MLLIEIHQAGNLHSLIERLLEVDESLISSSLSNHLIQHHPSNSILIFHGDIRSHADLLYLLLDFLRHLIVDIDGLIPSISSQDIQKTHGSIIRDIMDLLGIFHKLLSEFSVIEIIQIINGINRQRSNRKLSTLFGKDGLTRSIHSEFSLSRSDTLREIIHGDSILSLEIQTFLVRSFRNSSYSLDILILLSSFLSNLYNFIEIFFSGNICFLFNRSRRSGLSSNRSIMNGIIISNRSNHFLIGVNNRSLSQIDSVTHVVNLQNEIYTIGSISSVVVVAMAANVSLPGSARSLIINLILFRCIGRTRSLEMIGT